jgi:5-methylcytosine-specific restriction endonuclease McrA
MIPACHHPPITDSVGKPCPYCGCTMQRKGKNSGVSRDHIVPRKDGGTLSGSNRMICCRRCNNDKASRPLQAWINKLRINNDPRLPLVEAVKKSHDANCAPPTIQAKVPADLGGPDECHPS